ncbi:MAG: hypothetical protein Q8R48_06240, partial [Candidatus Omnitrophota bacterium]|nr:hypothetical protein [Candidatus Omnitrophota bacterium]
MSEPLPSTAPSRTISQNAFVSGLTADSNGNILTLKVHDPTKSTMLPSYVNIYNGQGALVARNNYNTAGTLISYTYYNVRRDDSAALLGLPPLLAYGVTLPCKAIHYGADGAILRTLVIDANNDFPSITIHNISREREIPSYALIRDMQDRLIAKNNYDRTGILISYIIYEYDAYNRLIRSSLYRQGQLVEQTNYKYDAQGRQLIDWIGYNFDANGNPESKVVYKYDSNGNLDSREGKSTWRLITYYISNPAYPAQPVYVLEQQVGYVIINEVAKEKVIQNYEAYRDPALIGGSGWRWRLGSVITYEYDASGNVIQTETDAYYASGNLESKTFLVGDADGNIYYHYYDENIEGQEHGRVGRVRRETPLETPIGRVLSYAYIYKDNRLNMTPYLIEEYDDRDNLLRVGINDEYVSGLLDRRNVTREEFAVINGSLGYSSYEEFIADVSATAYTEYVI